MELPILRSRFASQSSNNLRRQIALGQSSPGQGRADSLAAGADARVAKPITAVSLLTGNQAVLRE